MQISKGSASDSSNLLGRLARVEALLSQYRQEEIVADIFGRGRWRMDALVRPSSTEEVEAASNGRLVLTAGTEPNKIRVTVGEINFIVPTMGGVPLDNDPAPELTIPANRWIYAKVVGTFGSTDTYAVTIETESTSTRPTPLVSPTGFTSYLRIGAVELVSGVATIVENRTGGDMKAESFGSVNHMWRI